MSHSQQETKSQSSQSEITPQTAFVVGGTILLLGAYRNWPRFGRFYFEYFEIIYLIAYAVFALFGAATARFIVRNTKALSIRVRLLLYLSKERPCIYVGTTNDGARIYLPDSVRVGHVQVLGSTGRGKTESVVIAWLARDLAIGRSILLIDGKGDPEIAGRVRRMSAVLPAKPEVIVFDLGNPDSSCTTNPLASGSAQQITDRVFTAFEFEDPYYRAVQYDVCSSVVQLLVDAHAKSGPEVSFRSLYDCLTDERRLTELFGKHPNPALERKISDYLHLPKEVREQRLSGLLSQLAPFAVGEVAPLVNGSVSGRSYCTVSELVLAPDNAQKKAFILLIPTLKYQALGHQLGKCLLQELGWAVGERSSRMGKSAPFLPCFLDEFSAFVYPGFANILNKARSSSVALHLSHQSLADLSVVSDDFAQIITGNTNTKCILGLNDPDSADFMARHIGTKTQEKLTEQAEKRGLFDPRQKTGSMSIRDVEAYTVHPNSLKSFTNGRGVIHFPTERGIVTEEVQFERIVLNDGGGNG